MGKKFCRKFVCCLLMMTMMSTVFASSSFASDYAFNSYRMQKNTQIKYYVHRDYGATTMADMNEALYQWHAALGWNPMYRDPNVRHTLIGFPSEDGTSRVYRKETGLTGSIADNQIYTDHFGYFAVESDVNLNMSYSWCNGAQAGRYDAWSIFLHETGHTLGLANVDDNSALVMSGVAQLYRTNTIAYRYLKEGDKKGLEILYG